MADDWHFTRNRNLQGPVSFERLQKLAHEGWLLPTDLVWHVGMTDWIPASDVQGLFGSQMGQLLQRTLLGRDFIDPLETAAAPRQSRVPELPPAPKKLSRRRAQQAKATQVHIAWEQWRPRHVIAAMGGFLAALGIAFTVIDQSRVALAFTITGLCIAAAGLCVEVGQLFGQAFANIARAWKESAERKLRAQELALEKQRLDLEVARLAQQDKHLERILPGAPVGEQVAPAALTESAATGQGQVVVINQPPVKLWSPGLAAVLSFFLPGLGQLYKGQFLNGLAWFFMVMLGYAALFVPGLILHFFCVLGALSGDPWTEGKTTVVRQ
jgi:TM2 domain-containing membrane protein YozV